MVVCGTFQKLRPLSLLKHLSSCYDTAHLQVCSNSVSWSIYLDRGKITYASHSVEPFDRLDRHLRCLSAQVPTVATEIRAQLRLNFEAPGNQAIQYTDYQALCWLVEREYLNLEQASVLVESLVKEVFESFLLIEQGTYQLSHEDALNKFSRLELQPIIEHCQQQLEGWQALAPQISSPFQRPYLLSQAQQLLAAQPKLSKMLKGFSFYHLAVIQNQTELQLAQSLHQYIVDGSILLHEPHPPYEKLPKIGESPRTHQARLRLQPEITSTPVILETYTRNINTYTIICVDDDPIILETISLYLEHENLSLVLINNPIESLMQIITLNPDLILLDVVMPVISGYELCRLLRHHPYFKTKPILILKEDLGILDRVKAKILGASGCLTKPFTQAELIKLVFRHLAQARRKQGDGATS